MNDTCLNQHQNLSPLLGVFFPYRVAVTNLVGVNIRKEGNMEGSKGRKQPNAANIIKTVES